MPSARPDQKVDSVAGPKIQLYETGAAADQSLWDILVASGVLAIRTRTDADATGADVISVTRSGTTVVTMTLSPATLIIPIASVQAFADDAAAEAGSVPVGGIYRTASALKIRAA